MPNVVITGHLGFIGRNLAEKFSREEVLGISENIFYKKDWRVSLQEKLDSFKPKVVFHVGACSNTLETDVNYMMIRNHEFTVVLSDWCRENKVPLIYSSSAANEGSDGENPSNLYGWSKKTAEDVVVRNGQVALRYFNVYGPGEEEKGKMASVAFQSYAKNLMGKDVLLFPGKPLRDFVYVKDVVSANIFAFENYEKLRKQFYHVGSGESRSFEDVLRLLNIQFSYHPEDKIPKGYQFHTSSKRELMMPEWQPRYSLERGLGSYQEYLENFFQNNEKMQNFLISNV